MITPMTGARIYCGIVFFSSGGSSWANAATPAEAASKAAKVARSDWKLDKRKELKVCIFDTTGHEEGWYADHEGVHDRITKDLIPRVCIIMA